MTQLTLTEQDIKQLVDFIQEIPTKYGMHLINYLNQKIQEQTPVDDKTSLD